MKGSMFSQNLRSAREHKGLTQDDLSERIGISRVSISLWETQGKKPRNQKTIDALCNALDVTEQDLFGFADGFFAKSSGMAGNMAEQGESFSATAPVVGNIAAGDPNAAIEMSEETHDLPQKVRDRFPDGFFLIVRGDSMNKVLPDGCYAYIAPAEELEIHSGDIAAVKVNGDEATVKRVKLYDDLIVLEPESTNQEHKRRIIDSNDPDAPYVRMLGRVVWYDYEFISF